jgi:hypothetical protein
VRLPRDWLGPRDEFIPFGSSAARDDCSDSEGHLDAPPSAADFWDEGSAAVQNAVQGPGSDAGAERTAHRARGQAFRGRLVARQLHWRRWSERPVAAARSAAASSRTATASGISQIARHGRLAGALAVVAVVSAAVVGITQPGSPGGRAMRITASTPRALTPSIPTHRGVLAVKRAPRQRRHRPTMHHRHRRVSASATFVHAVTAGPSGSQSSASGAASGAGGGPMISPDTSSSRGSGSAGGAASSGAGGGAGGTASGAGGAAAGTASGAPAGPVGPGAAFGPGHLG